MGEDYFKAEDLAGPGKAIHLEYAALRDESMRRIEARQQQLSITLTLAGVFLGVGWNIGSAVGLFIFPPLALLLAAAWVQNEVRLQQIGTYLREQLEPNLPGTGWARYTHQREQHSRILGLPLEIFAVGGIFLLTQLFAILLGLFHFQSAELIEWILLALDVFSVFALFALVNYVGSQSRI